MKEFNTFYFERFKFDKNSLKASFFYSFDEKEFFEEIIDFKNLDFKLRENIDLEIINNLLYHLHIALWISYYKLFPTKDLIIKSGFLDDKQINFWKKFYKNWLWEFFIKNNFDFKDILNFENFIPTISNKIWKKIIIKKLRDFSLLMWWGGKDSIVSSIILEEKNKNFDAFVFGKIDKIKEDSLKILWKNTMLVKRELSENLFEFNKKWYYNWHVPITWIIAFVSLVSAYLYNYKNIVLSNEASACEENITWKWLKINHQYSKSEEFEKDFRKYVKNYIWDFNYYSILRDKFELEIAEIFAKKASKFFHYFSSCNKNFKINWKKQDKRWCCNCEKCAFVYLILWVYLEEEQLIEIFWENLFENKNLLNTYKWLLWFNEHKPFECVGTFEESRIAFKKNIERYKKKNLPYILQKIWKK